MDDREIIKKYLKEKNNEEEVIALLKEQKRILTDPKNNSVLLTDEYLPSMIKLARSSKGNIKYHAIIILSRIDCCTDVKKFL